MISQEENDVLTRTGADTPCGELLRRYWQAAALAEELPQGRAPLKVTVLGEDLVTSRSGPGYVDCIVRIAAPISVISTRARSTNWEKEGFFKKLSGK